MIISPLLAFVATLATSVLGQDLTDFTGTWSSGSQAVLTGPGFANPANLSFNYPKTSGISYSFSPDSTAGAGYDGYYEIARYRFSGNGTQPNCITGVMNWAHGRYTKNTNGSLTLTPFGDGYQQIQDPCAAVSNFIENYNDTELVTQWQMFLDPVTGLKLHLWSYDGSPMAPMFQVSATPNMLPTQSLRNVTDTATTTTDGYTQEDLVTRSESAARSIRPESIVGLAVTGLGVAAAALLY